MGTKVKIGRNRQVTEKVTYMPERKPKPLKISPISFSELLAGKVHDGSKTMTRRVVEFMPNPNPVSYDSCKLNKLGCWFSGAGMDGHQRLENVPAPYAVGQLLYVREPWAIHLDYDKIKPSALDSSADVEYLTERISGYRLDSKNHCFPDMWRGRYRQARFMPKKYARTFLRVTEVRCERLCDITHSDAIAEGIERKGAGWRNYLEPDICMAQTEVSFQTLWDHINHKKTAPKFKDSPWVWVVSFERVEMPNPWNQSVDVVVLNSQNGIGKFTHPVTNLVYTVTVGRNSKDEWSWGINNVETETFLKSVFYGDDDSCELDLNRFLRLSILNPWMLK